MCCFLVSPTPDQCKRLKAPLPHWLYMDIFMTRTESFFSFSPVCILVPLCALFLVLSGCAKQPTGDLASPATEGFVDIDAPDVIVEPYVPIDDGKPLTQAELAAFNSTGELDATLTQEEKQLVELFFKSYVHNYRGTVERFLKRSEIYMPFVEQVLRDRGLPVEIACLAFVESGFNPNAVSRAGAGGMWQFMPFTGRKYGLSQDRWMDERRDPYKATLAAAEYLTRLYDYFGKDWHLAIAAYNAGEGKIGRALAGTDSKTFFEICRKNDMLDDKARLKEETQQYLPRFLAFVKIMRNLETLGFSRPDPNKAPKLAEVIIPAGVDLQQFSKDINLNWEQFKGLNPAYLRAISPPDRKSKAHIPVVREEVAKEWLSRKNIAVYAGWRDYRVKKNDSLGKIAHRTGSSTALLRQANNKSSNSLRVGEFLLVPGSARAAQATMKIVSPTAAPVIARAKDGKPLSGYSGTHAIASGDTLYGLALAWGTSVDDICLLNDIEPSTRLRIGQKLYIPSKQNTGTHLAARPVEQTPEAKPDVSLVSKARSGPGFYVAVQQGDTLSGIAQKNGVSVADICRANNITPKTRLSLGRELYIASGAAAIKPAVPKADAIAKPQGKPQTLSKGKGNATTIRPGDTLYSLARTHGISVAALAKRNNIRPGTTLRVGQVLYIP